MASILNSLKSASDLVYYSRRPLPKSPDGLTSAEAQPPSLSKGTAHGKLYDIITDIQAAIKRGLPIDLDEQTFLAFEDAILHSQTVGINDRYMLLEKIITLMERLPLGSEIQKKIEDAVIEYLYNDLSHPPATYLGKKYQFRSADGSYNNINIPDLGKARTPYVRSVQSQNPIPLSSRPDPDLIFDALLKREGTHPHPAGISSLLFQFANIIIHNLFKTDEKYPWINDASSYLDLAPLYGDSEHAQRSVRVLDGHGLLHEDTFADQRLLMMPPATPALLIIFCRNHNYIAQKLLEINERGTYTDPPPQNDPAALMTQDDDIFNRARLVNCGHFVNIILTDYLGAILGTFKDGSEWNLNPLDTIRTLEHDLVPRGQGNAVSVEFNLIYRWHATISIPDEEWTEGLFRGLFPDNNFHNLTPVEFNARMRELRVAARSVAEAQHPTVTAQQISNDSAGGAGGGAAGATMPPTPSATVAPNGQPQAQAPPAQKPAERAPSTSSQVTIGPPNLWTFAGLDRDPVTNRFDDDALANILQNATATIAQGFRARGTPEVLRVVEVMAMQQARDWGVCTLNEFRTFIGLRPYSSFKEWNPDPEIAQAAETLYGHIDKLELYPGVQAEETKTPGEGAALCPGYTISRAILGDAVALVRGDRFFTTDFTPYNLTAWGFQDCARDTNNGAFGSGITKLLLRSLPNNFTYNNVYGLFPFYTPDTMKGILTNLKTASQYTFERPKVVPEVVTVNTWQGVTQVLGDYRTFKTTYGEATRKLTNGYGFFIAWDDPPKHLKDLTLMHEAIYGHQDLLAEWVQFYGKITKKLIAEKSCSLVGRHTRSVDIVRDVVNLVPVHWVSTYIAGIPLKTAATPKGLHTEQEVYQFLAVVFTYIFLNVAPETGWVLENNAEEVATLLQGYIKDNIDANRKTSVIGKLKAKFLDWYTADDDKSSQFLKNLAKTGRPSDQLAYNVFGIIVAASPNFSMAAALVVNFYLDDERKKEREELIKLCNEDTPEGNARLLGYILEAMRLDPQAPGIFREAALDAEVKEGAGVPSVKVQKGQQVFVSLQNADLDPTVFGKDPTVIDPTRPLKVYRIFGDGMHSCLGRWFVESTMPQVIRSIFTLKNIRRAPGQSGQLNRFRNVLYETTPSWLYLDVNGNITPWPASMMIQYDY